MSKKVDYASMTNDELIENYKNLKSELFGLRFQLTVGQLADTNKITMAKKNIARVLTEMTKRGIDANSIKMPKVAKKSKAKKAKPVAKKVEKPAKKVEKAVEAAPEAVKAEPKQEKKVQATAKKESTIKKASKKGV